MRAVAAVLGFFLALGSPGLASADASASCKTAHARYAMMGAPGFTAGFRPQPRHEGWQSDAAFFIHSDQSRKTFWFLFDGGTARYINLISTTDVTVPGWSPPPPEGGVRPLGSMHYMAADADLKFSLEIPRQATPAPTYVLLPDLSEKLRYGQAGPDQEDAPVAFFKLVGC